MEETNHADHTGHDQYGAYYGQHYDYNTNRGCCTICWLNENVYVQRHDGEIHNLEEEGREEEESVRARGAPLGCIRFLKNKQ